MKENQWIDSVVNHSKTIQSKIPKAVSILFLFAGAGFVSAGYAACESQAAEVQAVQGGDPTAANYQNELARAQANMATCMQAEAQNQARQPIEEVLVTGSKNKERVHELELERLRVAMLENLQSLFRDLFKSQYQNENQQTPAEKNPATEDEKDHKTCLPVMIESGKKVLTEIDYRDNIEFPLEIERNYSSSDGNGQLFGPRWRARLDNHLMFAFLTGTNAWCNRHLAASMSNGACDRVKNSSTLKRIYLSDAAGFSKDFIWSATQSAWVAVNPEHAKLSLSQLSDSRWQLVRENGDVEIYGLNGRLESISNSHSIGWTLAYDSTTSNKLQSISHSSGKSLLFQWGTNNRISAVTDPNGNAINYTYETTSAFKRLETVTFPGSTGVRKYHYSSNGALLGYSIDNIRRTEYTYATETQTVPVPSGPNAGTYTNVQVTIDKVATSGKVGGIEKSTFTYNSNSTVVTNAKGASTTYYYDSPKRRLVSNDRASTSTCPSAAAAREYLNAESNNLLWKDDWKGNRTTYTYDAL